MVVGTKLQTRGISNLEDEPYHWHSALIRWNKILHAKPTTMKNIELIALIALSWLVIRLFEKGNWSVLGLKPTTSRLKLALILFVITALCCASEFFLRMYFGKEQFALNPSINPGLALTGIWLNVESVLFEELLCRGVGLYILLKKWGQKWAIFISAIVFGLLHILDNSALSHPVQALLTFGYTFIMGLLLGYAYAKTRSLYMPFAIHFGWNLTQNFIFPAGPFGNSLFISVLQPEVTVSYLVYFMMLFFPKLSAMGFDFLILKRQNHVGN